MPSDAAPDRTPDEGSETVSASEHVQRAALLADLEAYPDAIAELEAALALEPDDSWARAMLARVYLVTDRPADALVSADQAVESAPGQVAPLVVRGIALVELHRFAEAAQVAEQIIQIGPQEAYAQRTGAALLSETRNGQVALDTAWHAVTLAPTEPESHLVLAVVAARLHQFDLAERAYREAIRLNPDLEQAGGDSGLLRLEQRRYARALAGLAAEAAQDEPVAFDPRTRETATQTLGRTTDETLHRTLLAGGTGALIVAILVAFCAAVDEPLSRFAAVTLTVLGAIAMAIYLAQVPRVVRERFPRLLRTERSLMIALVATGAMPAFILAYAVIGTPWPLALSIAAGVIAELIIILRARRS
ncbi:tetratricopeptide repeat protein [Catenuloplanes atrovinosus]|uniref:Tetratricopeptide (TPR) repeat protein n=1 Tax=Catenuloplanes atrovinosus TaxID=137266 RepID=A0AAE4CG48_9ACTN|nr:tetratricopeptide repeat protein [Catenuloplanes atrovinosus]MDR7280335.1 tetratricopeptide (TPR) repeat protein [Catenuloplanes atrovinosus]